MEHISTKKLYSVLSSQKPSNNKTVLGYTREGRLSSEPKKEVRFVLAKYVEKPKGEKPKVEKPKVEAPIVAKRTVGAKLKEK